MVSIIIPHFNRPALLNETIRSVKDQTLQDWEIILIDDNSDRDEWDRLAAYAEPGIHIYKNSSGSKGAGACRNFGLQFAKGAYIIFLDSDDLLENFCLEQRMKIMAENASLGWAVFPQYIFKGEQATRNELFSKQLNSRAEAIQYFLQMDPPWQTMASIWKRETLEQLGAFDESLVFMEDPDLHLRALLRDDVKVGIEFSSPADSFYRINAMDDAAATKFFQLSIRYRFAFIYKTVSYLIENKHCTARYQSFIRTGYIDFLKVFLLSRLRDHVHEFTGMNTFLAQHQVISMTDRLKFRILKKVFTSESVIFSALRLKGLFYRML